MNSRDESPLHLAIDAKLTSLLEPLSSKPNWCERWRQLNAESSREERLEVYQAIRDSGILPEDAGFYLVSWQIDSIADDEAETALRHLDERLSAIQSEHGLAEDEVWEPTEAPQEYRDLLEEYHDAWDALFAELLERYGEHPMAELFATDRAEYDRRSDTGREYFHGPLALGEIDNEVWLDILLDTVSVSIEPESPMGPLGLLYREDDGFWEVDVYPTSVELVGGAEDGAIVSPPFSLDLERLRSAFDRIDDMGWEAFGWYDGDGPFIWFEGSFYGRDVWLRVLAQAPEDQEPGAKLRVTRKDSE